jgi:hypothetical protein
VAKAKGAGLSRMMRITLLPFLRVSSTSVPSNTLNSPTQSLAPSTRFPLKTCPTRTFFIRLQINLPTIWTLSLSPLILKLWWEIKPVNLKSGTHHATLRQMVWTQLNTRCHRESEEMDHQKTDPKDQQDTRVQWTQTTHWLTSRICRWRTSLWKTSEQLGQGVIKEVMCV